MGHGLETVPGAAGRMNGRRESEGRGVSLLAVAVSTGETLVYNQIHILPVILKPLITATCTPTQQKQRHYLANKGPSSQGYGFSSSHAWM